MSQSIKALLGILTLISTCDVVATEHTTAQSYASNTGESNDNLSNTVRLYFTNFEGAEYMVLCSKHMYAPIGTKGILDNFMCGYCDYNLNRPRTFNLIAFYPDGSYSDTIPLSMTPWDNATEIPDIPEQQAALQESPTNTNTATKISTPLQISGPYISCDDISKDAIVSANSPHTFLINNNDKEISDIRWHLYMKNEQNEYVCTESEANTATFSINAIYNSDDYLITEDRLSGIIECMYHKMSYSTKVYETILYPITFEFNSLGEDDIYETFLDNIIEIYTMQGIRIYRGNERLPESLSPGVYIRRWVGTDGRAHADKFMVH